MHGILKDGIERTKVSFRLSFIRHVKCRSIHFVHHRCEATYQGLIIQFINLKAPNSLYYGLPARVCEVDTYVLSNFLFRLYIRVKSRIPAISTRIGKDIISILRCCTRLTAKLCLYPRLCYAATMMFWAPKYPASTWLYAHLGHLVPIWKFWNKRRHGDSRCLEFLSCRQMSAP